MDVSHLSALTDSYVLMPKSRAKAPWLIKMNDFSYF